MRISVVVIALTGCWRNEPAPVKPASDTLTAPTGDPVPPPSESDAESAKDVCTRDEECIVTNVVTNCCICPQCSLRDPVARSKKEMVAFEASCEKERPSCDMRICAVAGMCPQGEDASLFSARCRAGACVGIRKPSPR